MDEHPGTMIGRRALFAAGVGAVAALFADALGRPAAALGADGDPMRIGAGNTGTRATTMNVGPDPALKCVSTSHDGAWGQSKAAGKSGVYGFNSDKAGFEVFGRNTATGVAGSLGGPAGVKAEASGNGIALDVKGRARFSRSGGLMVPKGRDSAAAGVADATSFTKVIATVQTDVKGGKNSLRAAYVYGGGVEVRLTQKAETDTWVAWMVFE